METNQMENAILAISSYKEIILGGIIASIGFIYKSRIDKKRKLKQAYYYLFEIWHFLSAIHTFQPDKLSKNIVEEIISDFKLKSTEEEIEQYSSALKLILIAQVKPILIELTNKSVTKLSQPFEYAVKEIALDYPLLAYKINTTIELDKLTESLNSLVSSVEDISKEERIHATNVIEDKVYTDSASALLKSLKCLAFKISLVTYIKSHYYIYKRHNRLKLSKKNIKSEVIPFIKGLVQNK